MSSLLTRDNIHLSRITNSPDRSSLRFSVHCKRELPEDVATFVQASLSENTRRAYLSDLAHFEAWGGRVPATEEIIASYIAEHAGKLSVASLGRRIASISIAHDARGFPSPTKGELVRATMRGIKRRYGSAQREAKALLRDDLFAVLDKIGGGIKDRRDRALLLIGFAGGFRRSELVALDVCDAQIVKQGLILALRRSKTDQEGVGRTIGIPFGRTRFCPVLAFERWLETLGREAGPIFRPINRHGQIASERLTGEAVSTIVKQRLAAAGIDPANYSGHSLRAGFATSAAMAGVASWRIREQTGHASDAMLSRYIRRAGLFSENPAGAIL